MTTLTHAIQDREMNAHASTTLYVMRNEVELELAIEGKIYFGAPATRLDPEEHTEVEIKSAVVVKDAPGYPEGTVIELTLPEGIAAEEKLLEEYEETAFED